MTSLATLLFDNPADGRRRLDAALGPGGLNLGQLSIGGFAIEPPKVTGALLDLLEMPLGNLAVHAWGTAMRVERAKERTLMEPGSRQVLTFMEHTITARQSPTVEASYGGATTPILKLTIEVEIHVDGARVVVEEGRIVDITNGPSTASATVSAGDVTLFHHETRSVDLAVREPSTSRRGDR